jgi:alcohol dehydrogenase (nicotinoprotein)
MKTRAAVLRKGGEPWEITELDRFGGANPLYDIPMILGLWQAGDVKLTELVTKRYTLDQVNEGYQDMMDGKNLRGVIIHEH